MVDEKKNYSKPFRQQALEHISAPQPLEKFIQNPGYFAWGLLTGLGLCIISLLLWLFCGSIVIQQSGKGLVLSSHEAIVFIPAFQQQKIQPGMKVYVYASGQLTRLSHPISGKVISVDNLLVDPQDALNILKNQSLVNYFLGNAPVMSLRVYFSKEIASGALIQARINLRRQSPWSLFLLRNFNG
jgi:hypothetical protein